MMAEKLKVGEAFTEGLDSAAWIERLYEQSRADASAHGINLPAFQAFKQLGLVDLQQLKKPTPVVMLSDFRSDPEKHPLTTPSGKIEIFSATIDSYQLEDRKSTRLNSSH